LNKFILEQLNNCRIANISPYNNDSTEIYINGIRKEKILQFNKYYHIVLENYIVNPPPNFDLATNWNDGTTPEDPDINAEIIQATNADLAEAKMLRISGKCEPSGKFWTGWVPKKSIIRIEELE